ncbi:MAG TPA: cellulose biosynthesis cyclic di-GMP-binding regulatory protein BcsB [Gallionellaceae bacterium]
MNNNFRRAMKVAALLAAVLWLQQAALADTVRLPLQKFTSASSLEMRCMSGGQNISIPIPQRWKVTKAVLNLHYTVSNNMLPDLSQMVLRINGELVSQMKLDNMAPGTFKEIVIPVERLRPGYNNFSFQVAQHYMRNQCEQPCSPDLWTNISVMSSSIQMDYEMRPIPLKLGEAANWVFDPKQFPEGAVNLVADTSTPEAVTMMSMAASGIARRFDYRKVKFSHSDDIRQGMDNVLIGTTAFVGEVLARYGIPLEAQEGGLIKVFYVPKKDGGKDGLHALIVVTGKQEMELKIAAETFANMSLPYPGTDEMRAVAFSMPDISMYSGREELIPDKVYEFSTLGLQSSSFLGFNGRATPRGFSNPASDISFRLPPDFMIKQNQYAKLKLNFSYGAGLRPDSSLNVSLNERQIRDIHLDSPSGNYIEEYRLDIPTYLFKPGTNTITFRPYLNTVRQVCDASNTEGLFVTIFGNSTLSFPPMPHFVEMPKTELFVLNGFPFTRWPDGYETMVYLPQHDSGSIDTALNLVGMITQKNGFPLFGTKVVFAEPKDWEGELLVVGEANAIPKSLMALAPFQPDGAANIPYPVARGWDSETSIAISKQRAGLGAGSGLLMEFESPNKRGRSVVIATAQTEKDLLALGDALLSPGIQARIKGDVSLVQLDVPEYDVVSMDVGKNYSTGDKGGVSRIDAFLYANPYIFYGLIALGLVALSWFLFWLARRNRAKRLGQ